MPLPGPETTLEATVLKEFKAFITRGNVVDLAVAVVVGAAFTAIVTSFTNDVLGQLLAAVGGEPDFSDLVLPLRTVEEVNPSGEVVTVEVGLRYGSFLTAIVNFVIVALAMFLVVKAINTMQGYPRTEEEELDAELTEVELLTEIRDLLAGRDGS